MGNRVRPRCQRCGKTMSPIYLIGKKGGQVRVKDGFACSNDHSLARGRQKFRHL